MVQANVPVTSAAYTGLIESDAANNGSETSIAPIYRKTTGSLTEFVDVTSALWLSFVLRCFYRLKAASRPSADTDEVVTTKVAA